MASSLGLQTTVGVTFNCSGCLPGEEGLWDESLAVLLVTDEDVPAAFGSMLTCFSFSFTSVKSPAALTSGAFDSTSALLPSVGALLPLSSLSPQIGTNLESDTEDCCAPLTLANRVPWNGSCGGLQTATRLAAARPGEILSVASLRPGVGPEGPLELTDVSAAEAESEGNFLAFSLLSTSIFSSVVEEKLFICVVGINEVAAACCGSAVTGPESTDWPEVSGATRALDFS